MPVVERGLFAETDAVAGLSNIPHILSSFGSSLSAICCTDCNLKGKKKIKKNPAFLKCRAQLEFLTVVNSALEKTHPEHICVQPAQILDVSFY